MEATQLLLADGGTALSAKLHTYFTTVFQAEDSGEEFPVELDHVWRIGYATKGGAVKALRKNFVKDLDYQSFIQINKREVGATSVEVYHLSVSCLEYLSVRSNREVFKRYRACRLRWANSLP